MYYYLIQQVAFLVKDVGDKIPWTLHHIGYLHISTVKLPDPSHGIRAIEDRAAGAVFFATLSGIAQICLVFAHAAMIPNDA